MTPERFEKLKAVLDRRQPDLTVFADGVQKSHNVSAILRTCDAVGISRMHAVSTDGNIRRHHLTAGGSKRWVDVVTHASSAAGLAALRADGWRIVVADASSGSVDFREVDYTARVAIVMGEELCGPSDASKAAKHIAIRIPMQGLVESLNVSVATAVILYEAERQRHEAGLYENCRIGKEEYARKLFEWSHPVIARRCRERGLDYPTLTADGDLAENPFA